MTMNAIPEPSVNHQAESPTEKAICAVPTVALPPMTVPAIVPATIGAPAARPPRLYPSADFTERAAKMPPPSTSATVASMKPICAAESSKLVRLPLINFSHFIL